MSNVCKSGWIPAGVQPGVARVVGPGLGPKFAKGGDWAERVGVGVKEIGVSSSNDDGSESSGRF